ncbi:hypothetical protein [Elioraea sp.]|jgi:ascorbate-specific PTS system EIIC-type component UlaA|uniref:hypothetical protein n=1 Tax=Elioraea sp. TaxID=2185103 RepID=UPI003F712E14
MRHVMGVILIAAGATLIWTAMARRNAILAEARRLEAAGVPDPRATLHPSLAILGDVVPTLMIGGLAVMAVKVVLAYTMTGADRWFSPLDLGGFLFLLAAWSTWLVLKTRHRAFPVPPTRTGP